MTRLPETVSGGADPMTTELIGWVSVTILLATIGLLDRRSQGVSKWLFIGQIMASVGFRHL
jgi:MtN3 and saliva related transmembrane protein